MATDTPMNYVVVYHKGCPDGLAAAAVMYKVMEKMDMQLFFIGMDPEEQGMLQLVDALVQEFGKAVAVRFVDLAFTPALYEKVKSNFTDYAIFDHHKSTAALPSHSRIHFDLNESAATLVWDFYYNPRYTIVEGKRLDMPLYLRYVKDRDLFRFAEPKSRTINAGLRKLAAFHTTTVKQSKLRPLPQILYFVKGGLAPSDQVMDFPMLSWLEGDDSWVESAETLGTLALDIQQENIEAMARSAQLLEVEGLRVCAINAAMYISDLAEYLYKKYDDADYVLVWRYEHRAQKCYISLRSAQDKIDVDTVAKKYGGGGHAHAAGFECTMSQLQQLLQL